MILISGRAHISRLSVTVFVLISTIVPTSLLSIPSYFAEAVETSNSDFNGDGYVDLAVGVPDENVGSIIDAGAVNVLYGNSSG